MIGRRTQLFRPAQPTDVIRTAAALSSDEQRAGALIAHTVRRFLLRRRWKRLVRVVISKQRIDRRLNAEKDEQRRRDAALTLFRIWKRHKLSVKRVVLQALAADHSRVRKAFFAQKFDFSEPKKLAGFDHVDWHDMDAGQQVLSGRIESYGATVLSERLEEILGFESDGLRQELESSVKALRAEEATTCHKCGQRRAGTEFCDKCNRVSCLTCRGAHKKCAFCSTGQMSTANAGGTGDRLEMQIDACTLTALVYFATNPKIEFVNFRQVVIGTIPVWASKPLQRKELVHALRDRFLQRKAEDVTEQISDFIRSWIAEYPNSDARRDLRDYLDDYAKEFGARDAFGELVESLLNAKPARARPFNFTAMACPPSVGLAPGAPLEVPFIPPIEFARQLTLIEYYCFSAIRKTELFCTAWSSKRKERLAPNVLLMTRHFNRVSTWMSATILSQKTAQGRADMLSYFINLQRQLMYLSNFNGMFEVHACLSSSHVRRLQLSWNLVDPLELASFARMDQLLSPQGNYKEYRKLLQAACGSSCIPYIGQWLTDLTMLDEKVRRGFVFFPS